MPGVACWQPGVRSLWGRGIGSRGKKRFFSGFSGELRGDLRRRAGFDGRMNSKRRVRDKHGGV